jgi:hypothetical protein
MKKRSCLFFVSFLLAFVFCSSLSAAAITETYNNATKTLIVKNNAIELFNLTLIENTDVCFTNCYATMELNNKFQEVTIPANADKHFNFNWEKKLSTMAGLSNFDLSIGLTVNFTKAIYSESCFPYNVVRANETITFQNCTTIVNGTTKYEGTKWINFYGSTIPLGKFYLKVSGTKVPSTEENNIEWGGAFQDINLTKYWAWWNSTWSKGYDFNITGTMTTGKPKIWWKNFTGLSGAKADCSDVRVVDAPVNSGGTSVSRTILANGSDASGVWCQVASWLPSTTAGVVYNYSLYYSNAAATEPWSAEHARVRFVEDFESYGGNGTKLTNQGNTAIAQWVNASYMNLYVVDTWKDSGTYSLELRLSAANVNTTNSMVYLDISKSSSPTGYVKASMIVNRSHSMGGTRYDFGFTDNQTFGIYPFYQGMQIEYQNTGGAGDWFVDYFNSACSRTQSYNWSWDNLNGITNLTFIQNATSDTASIYMDEIGIYSGGGILAPYVLNNTAVCAFNQTYWLQFRGAGNPSSAADVMFVDNIIVAENLDFDTGGWQLVVTQGATSQGINSIKNATSVQIAPATAYKTTALNGSAIVTDNEQTQLNITMLWWKNGVMVHADAINQVANGTNVTQLLGVNNFTHFDNITLSVKIDDGQTNSSYVNSTAKQISNSLPTTGTPTLSPTTVYEGNTITCTPVSSADADSDVVTNNTAWWKNGAVISGQTAATLASTQFNHFDNITCQITPSDAFGSGSAVNSTAKQISNSVPSPANLTLNITFINTQRPARILITASDNDTDTMTAKATVFWPNGSLYINNATMSASGSNFEYNFTANISIQGRYNVTSYITDGFSTVAINGVSYTVNNVSIDYFAINTSYINYDETLNLTVNASLQNMTILAEIIGLYSTNVTLKSNAGMIYWYEINKSILNASASHYNITKIFIDNVNYTGIYNSTSLTFQYGVTELSSATVSPNLIYNGASDYAVFSGNFSDYSGRQIGNCTVLLNDVTYNATIINGINSVSVNTYLYAAANYLYNFSCHNASYQEKSSTGVLTILTGTPGGGSSSGGGGGGTTIIISNQTFAYLVGDGVCSDEEKSLSPPSVDCKELPESSTVNIGFIFIGATVLGSVLYFSSKTKKPRSYKSSY